MPTGQDQPAQQQADQWCQYQQRQNIDTNVNAKKQLPVETENLENLACYPPDVWLKSFTQIVSPISQCVIR